MRLRHTREKFAKVLILKILFMPTLQSWHASTEVTLVVRLCVSIDVFIVNSSLMLSHQRVSVLPLQPCLIHLTVQHLIILEHPFLHLVFFGIFYLLLCQNFHAYIFREFLIRKFLNPLLHFPLMHLKVETVFVAGFSACHFSEIFIFFPLRLFFLLSYSPKVLYLIPFCMLRDISSYLP